MKVIEKRILALEAELARLRKLKEADPQLPEGFVVAKVVNTDSSASKYDGLLPDDEAFVVVPAELGFTVSLWADSSGVFVLATGKNFKIAGWATTPEEAIADHLGEPGH